MSRFYTAAAAGLALLGGCVISGCSEGGASVATDVPEVKVAPPREPSAPRPKGMPKKFATPNITVDPATGRPVAQ
jgi:hypothetical protein